MSTADQRGVAIVTGAARGIGATIARRLVQDGFAVAVNDIPGADEEADALVAELARAGGDAIAVPADVSRADDVRRLYGEAERRLGSVTVVVSNAGMLRMMPLAQTPDDVFAQTFAINVGGTFNMLREAATRVQGGGRIITLSSTTLALNLPGYGVYNGTKAAIEAFTKVLAKELRGRRITVNSVAPGPVATGLFLNGKTDEQIAQFSKMPPLERLGQPEDVANAVAFLAGPDGGWINGQVLRTNGGLA
jgi:3-oxoacyl-[acyl-carrier protein] reductase